MSEVGTNVGGETNVPGSLAPVLDGNGDYRPKLAETMHEALIDLINKDNGSPFKKDDVMFMKLQEWKSEDDPDDERNTTIYMIGTNSATVPGWVWFYYTRQPLSIALGNHQGFLKDGDSTEEEVREWVISTLMPNLHCPIAPENYTIDSIKESQFANTSQWKWEVTISVKDHYCLYDSTQKVLVSDKMIHIRDHVNTTRLSGFTDSDVVDILL